MGFIHRVLIFFVALAGLIDGSLIVGGALATWLTPGPLLGYMPTSLLLLGAAVGAAFAATIAANVVVRTSRGHYLPVLAVTAIAGIALAVAQVWLVQNWVHESFRVWLLVASVILIAFVATTAATVFRTPVPAPGRRVSAMMVGAIVVLVILAILLSLVVYLGVSALSTFS